MAYGLAGGLGACQDSCCANAANGGRPQPTPGSPTIELVFVFGLSPIATQRAHDVSAPGIVVLLVSFEIYRFATVGHSVRHSPVTPA
ncbi:MAG TPA: hypothetical protein VFA63_11765 [Pseudonocardiaceae bacterium]|nr:hypothetical protein [Pseudonocardiaceae bacterium]